MNDRRQRATLVNRPVVARPTTNAAPAPAAVAPTATPTATPTPTPTATNANVPATSAMTTARSAARALADPPRAAQLPRAMTIERPGATSTPFSLTPGERYVLGRHDAADVVFDDDSVSRLHGVLSHGDAGWTFEDYGSGNGSRLVQGTDAHEVVPHVPVGVGVGDIVELGLGLSRVRFTLDVPEGDRTRRASSEVSQASRAYAEKLRLAARTRVPVFLLGASGVGKTWSARRVHEMSELPGAFVPINCARLPQDPTSLHSELLGHVRGAYTGAEAARVGKLVQADGGTLFLDEVESLPPIAQGFLLDVLEGSGDIAPLGAGAVRMKPLAFRLVSASKKPLATSGLRQDLCERLAEGHLWRVPGLDERSADIPGLLVRFAEEQSALLGVAVVVTPAGVRFAQEARWPGHVRMLRAAVTALAQLGLARRLERGEGGVVAAAKARAASIEITDRDLQAHLDDRGDVFGGDEGAGLPQRGDARRLTRRQIEAAVDAAGGNQVKAAQKLGIARNTLRRRLSEPG